jgi:hypothetical protein
MNQMSSRVHIAGRKLTKLGIELSQATVAKYPERPRKPASPTWRMFLDSFQLPLKFLVGRG